MRIHPVPPTLPTFSKFVLLTSVLPTVAYTVLYLWFEAFPLVFSDIYHFICLLRLLPPPILLPQVCSTQLASQSIPWSFRLRASFR